MKVANLVSGMLISCLCLSAHAQAHLERIKHTNTITIGHLDSSIPLSYVVDNKPVGYAVDICMGIAEAIKQKLNIDLKVKPVLLTMGSRIPSIKSGNVDLVCGSDSNNAERQKEVSFSPTIFVSTLRFVSKKSNNFSDLNSLKGQTITATLGTSGTKWLSERNVRDQLDLHIAPNKGMANGFLELNSGRAKAFFMDEIQAVGLVANSSNPSEWQISKDAYRLEPYGIIEPKDDPEFKALVDEAVTDMIKNGTISKLYSKWFETPIPPKNINLNWPMSEPLKKALAKPTDSPDPSDYK